MGWGPKEPKFKPWKSEGGGTRNRAEGETGAALNPDPERGKVGNNQEILPKKKARPTRGHIVSLKFHHWCGGGKPGKKD